MHLRLCAQLLARLSIYALGYKDFDFFEKNRASQIGNGCKMGSQTYLFLRRNIYYKNLCIHTYMPCGACLYINTNSMSIHYACMHVCSMCIQTFAMYMQYIQLYCMYVKILYIRLHWYGGVTVLLPGQVIGK